MATEYVSFATVPTLEGRTLSGIAYAFGQRTKRDGVWVDFAPGAFRKALKGSDVRAFFNHNPDMLLGRQSNGTVDVQERKDGLHYSIDVPDTSYGNDLLELHRRGDLTEMSFGITPGQTHNGTVDGQPLVTHTSVAAIIDISPVPLPAFEGTSMMLHSAAPEQSESIRSQLIRARIRRATGETQ
jgi:Escherichia/Staphylococcus phage prohead protease